MRTPTLLMKQVMYNCCKTKIVQNTNVEYSKLWVKRGKWLNKSKPFEFFFLEHI